MTHERTIGIPDLQRTCDELVTFPHLSTKSTTLVSDMLGCMAFSLAAFVAFLSCAKTRELPPCDSSGELSRPVRDPNAVVVTAAGDIAHCGSGAQAETASLVEQIRPDAVLALGDNAYPNGSIDDYLDCYDPAWGRFRSITRAAVGNHEYHTPHAGAFYSYFCGSSGQPFQGYYSFNLASWHVVALNSNCGGDLDVPAEVKDEFGGCDGRSPQAAWLRADLAAHPALCTLAMWHHPRFNTGKHGEAMYMSDLWAILSERGAELVLSGHAHDYERLAPRSAHGTLDSTGMRQFVVGTGGAPLTSLSSANASTEYRQADEHGVLKLVLGPSSYRWQFIATEGGTLDEGETPCHP